MCLLGQFISECWTRAQFRALEGYAFLQQFDLLAAQGTLKSLLQHHSSKASILKEIKWTVFFKLQKKQSRTLTLLLTCLGTALTVTLVGRQTPSRARNWALV